MAQEPTSLASSARPITTRYSALHVTAPCRHRKRRSAGESAFTALAEALCATCAASPACVAAASAFCAAALAAEFAAVAEDWAEFAVCRALSGVAFALAKSPVEAHPASGLRAIARPITCILLSTDFPFCICFCFLRNVGLTIYLQGTSSFHRMSWSQLIIFPPLLFWSCSRQDFFIKDAGSQHC